MKSACSPGSVHAPSARCDRGRSWAWASPASEVVTLGESSLAEVRSGLEQSEEVLASTVVPYTVAGIQPWG